MKIIGITQRIDTITNYKEKRNAIDVRWITFCNECKLLPIAIPNHLPTVSKLIKRFPFDGFIFTGGNTLSTHEGDAPERDEVEKFLLEYVICKKLPLIGICRGMQIIQQFFNIPLFKVKNHVKQKHLITFKSIKRTVNSYHDYGTTKTTPEVFITAMAGDGIVEAIQHQSYPIYGIMWHPERVDSLDVLDKLLFGEIFG